jgi:hypothetical protein
MIPTTKALATVNHAMAPAIEPTNMGELVQLATMAGKTGFFGAKSPEQALLVMMSGRDLGLSYAQSLRAFHVIEGRPTLSADGMVATCLVRRDVCEMFRTVEVTNEKATVETKRVGQEAQRYTFSMADAQRAGVAGKPNWSKYPSRMLLARARAALARDVYPDLLLGLYDPDELESDPTAPERVHVEVITPAHAAPEAVKAAKDVVDAAPSPIVADIRARFERCGREGTDAELNTIVADIVRAKFSREERDQLTAPYRDAQAAIAARKAPPPREPGDDSEAEEAERALAAQGGVA